MEVHQARVWLPRRDNLADASVVQPSRSTEPPREPLLRADIVAWENMQAAQASQHDVLRRPTAYAAQSEQLPAHRFIVLAWQRFDVDVSSFHGSGERQKCPNLLPAEADCPVLRRRPKSHIARGRKAVMDIACPSAPHVAHGGESIKQFQ